MTHAVFTQTLDDSNIQLQLIYEESPVFVGGEANLLSAIIRFKYIGPVPKQEPPQEPPLTTRTTHEDQLTVPTENSDSGGSWLGGFGRRVSLQFSNTTRNLLLQELETLDENGSGPDYEDPFKNSTLLLGYTQIFGYYTYNDQIFDSERLRDVQRRSVIGGKLAGITGLDFDDKLDGGFLSNVASGFGNIFNTTIIPETSSDLDASNGTGGPTTTTTTTNNNSNGTTTTTTSISSLKDDIVPFFSTSQSILFPELEFKPKETSSPLEKSFYMNIRLPKFLPPTYSSLSSLKIQYNLVLGYQVMDEKTHKWSNKILFFPLEIRPYVNEFGQQPKFDLLDPVIGYKVKSSISELTEHDSSFKDIREKFISQKRRRSSTMASTFNNEIGANGKLTSTPESTTTDRAKFFSFLREMNEKDVHDLIGIQEKFENEFLSLENTHNSNPDNILEEDVKENLISVFNNPENILAKIKKHNENPDLANLKLLEDDPKEYHSQVPAKQQLNFILKRNGELITTISLSKSIITFNESLKIHLSFKHSQVPITGIITRLLKVEKFNNSDFLRNEDEMIPDVELNNNFEFETRLNEVLVSCFNVNDEMSYDMLVPNDTIRTGQFKSNLIDVKYCVLFKFVLLDKKSEPDLDLDAVDDNYEFIQIYNDSKGSLYRGVDYISNGMEFYCKIPIIVLSSPEQDFGDSTGVH